MIRSVNMYSFCRNFLCKNLRLKNSQNLRTRGKYIPKVEKGEALLFWILQKIIEMTCFSAKIHQCNIAYSVVRVDKFVSKSLSSYMY